ncbi:MAG: hypothetical protein OEY62_03810, partial [Acidimicrobiia bacterium]|nr:hypothetical protein [Acidimicrobiia bacterium]
MASSKSTATQTESRLTRRFSAGLVAIAAVVLALLVPVNPTAADDQPGQGDLAQVRRATARYHDLDVAIADGYQLGYRNGIITGCIEHPTAGAMGYHYFNWDLIEDL